MTRRIRFLAAMMALIALTLSIGESAWASACPPGIGMGSGVALETIDANPPGGAHHGSPPASNDSERSTSDAPACPWGMTGVGNSCGSVSLQAVAAALAPAAVATDSASYPGDDVGGRLLISLHFRPPRA